MVNVFKRLIKRKRPSYILEVEDFEASGVHCIYCKYAMTGGKYFCATAYYTDAWLSANPLGPLGDGGVTTVQTLEDIAVVQELGSSRECLEFSPTTPWALSKFIENFRQQSYDTFDLLTLTDGDTLDITVCVSPVPMLMLKVTNSVDGLIGTVGIGYGGSVIPVMPVHPRMQKYVSQLQAGEPYVRQKQKLLQKDIDPERGAAEPTNIVDGDTDYDVAGVRPITMQ